MNLMQADPSHAQRRVEAALVAAAGRATPQQRAVFEAIADDNAGNLMIKAVAGSGKTTTLEWSAHALNPRHRVLMVAFTRVIADELDGRMPAQVDTSTLNSFGWQIGLRQRPRPTLAKYKTLEIAQDLWIERFGEPKPGQVRGFESFKWSMLRLISLFKAHGYGVLRPLPIGDDFSPEALMLVHNYGVELPADEAIAQRVIDLVGIVYRRSLAETTRWDFDDQLLMPMVLNLPIPRYDVVMVDESQDLNDLQIEMVRRAGEGGRTVLVGDDRQAIFGFRGANVEAIESLGRIFNTTPLPLSVSFRCARQIVDEARSVMPAMEAAPKAPAGSVTRMGIERLVDAAKPGDFVLSRTNAPLVTIALMLLRSNKKAVIRGRDLAQGLERLLGEVRDQVADAALADPWTAIDLFRRRTLSSARESANSSLADRLDTLAALAEQAATFEDVATRLELLFSDEVEGIVCSTIHKIKGLEADRVFLLSANLPHRLAKLPWEQQQESHLKGVAITRARRDLVYVDGLPSFNGTPLSPGGRLSALDLPLETPPAAGPGADNGSKVDNGLRPDLGDDYC